MNSIFRVETETTASWYPIDRQNAVTFQEGSDFSKQVANVNEAVSLTTFVSAGIWTARIPTIFRRRISQQTHAILSFLAPHSLTLRQLSGLSVANAAARGCVMADNSFNDPR
ncbi:hypothetical protein PC112_g17631 [Phytophthora cactorum]|nr:hypothetical protein PC112_g17631 [Phytophthora cactorum]